MHSKWNLKITVLIRAALQKTFDAVFCIDGTFATSPKAGHVQEVQAKVYAFSLRFFNKCVFLSPNSYVRVFTFSDLCHDKICCIRPWF